MDKVKLECLVDSVNITKKEVTLLFSNKIKLNLERLDLEKFKPGNVVTITLDTKV